LVRARNGVPKQHPPGSKANLQANLTEIAGFITQAI
jgi:hypothetical protein